MELTTYFSGRQRLTLKSLWIQGIILAVLGIIPCFFIDERSSYFRHAGQDPFSLIFLIITIKWSIVYGWEHIISKDYKKALITMAPFFILNIKIKQFTNQLFPFLPSFIDPVMIMIIWKCLQVTGVCYIAGKKNYWQTGLVAGLFICYITDVPPNPLGYIHFETISLLNILADFSLPFLIYGWIYLSENFFNDKGFKNIINSKIQVISGKEYQFLYPLIAISCWTIILQSVSFMAALSNNGSSYSGFITFQSQSLLTNAVTFVMLISIFYITASMTRNIVISRMNTIATQNGWMYLLHYMPVLNIITWISFSKKPDVHTTKNENAVYYTTRADGTIKNYIMGIGVLFSIWDLYGAYQYNRYEASAGTGILFLLMFGKLINYFFLEKGKSAVLCLVVIGCLGSLTQVLAQSALGRSASAFTLAIALSYFFLVEIFHPELEQIDSTESPEATIA